MLYLYAPCLVKLNELTKDILPGISEVEEAVLLVHILCVYLGDHSTHRRDGIACYWGKKGRSVLLGFVLKSLDCIKMNE
jgi:hypothetical protein